MSRQTQPDTKKSARAQNGNACFTYILRCADGSLYTGWTNDLQKRLASHNAGTGAKYTRGRRPVELVYYESFATKEEAMRREAEIKTFTREEKIDMIEKAADETGQRGEKSTRRQTKQNRK